MAGCRNRRGVTRPRGKGGLEFGGRDGSVRRSSGGSSHGGAAEWTVRKGLALCDLGCFSEPVQEAGMAGQPGFFDVDERLRRLSDLGDQLEAYGRVVDFELFRPELEAALSYSDGTKGGRPPCDPVMMFKVLVIQAQNNLSDERTEFLINDRLSFMRFLGLALGSGARCHDHLAVSGEADQGWRNRGAVCPL